MAVIDDTIVEPKSKLRLALEYVFWTIKILCKDKHEYVCVNQEGQKVKIGLTRVETFSKTVLKMEFRLSERIISSEYYQEWLEIWQQSYKHQSLRILTSPERNTLEKELMDS
jgi:hypothetical protein